MSEPEICPRCGAEDNTGVAFLCGTMVVGDLVMQSPHCAVRQLAGLETRVSQLESGLPRKTDTEADRYHRASKILDDQEPKP